MKNMNLKFKIVFITIGIYFCSIVLITILSVKTIGEQMERQITEDGIALTKQMAKHIESANSYEAKIDGLLEEKIKSVAYLIGQKESIDNAFLQEVSNKINVAEINLVDSSRKVIYSNLPGNIGYMYLTKHEMNPLFTNEKTEIIEEVRKSNSDNFYYKYGAILLENDRIIQVGIQIKDIEMLKASLTKQDIVEALGQEENVVYAVIIDKNLIAIAHSDPSRIGIKLQDKGSVTAALEGRNYSDKFFYEAEKVHTQDVLIPLYENGKHIGAINVGLSLKNLNLALRSIIIKAIIIALSFFIISGIILILVLRKVFRPLGDLVQVSKLICDGDLNQRINVNNNDEVGELSTSFNSMMDALQSKMDENNKLMVDVLQYDKLKTEFFANISHELRTPINVIFSALQLMELSYKDKADIKKDVFLKYKDTLKQNIYRLIRLVNNLIDITKIDSGFFEVIIENHNIISVVEDITLSVAQYIENKDIELTFDTEVEEKIIACDPHALERIMLNLLSNSVKFTKPGGNIKVNIFDKDKSIIISVTDTGSGIPKNKLDVIFQRFRQADELHTRNHEGSGIGLALTKELVQMHGGNISVESEYGIGTSFIIEIPIKVIAENGKEKDMPNYMPQSHIEKINLEFSDIYNSN
ncbi:ATP-binding protein [Clostridium sp.]|uniref:HAMP domain-containing sensor histidine kinase n=1 Tax=Clostridium sp. TaxID=1506 RepID=UPI002FC70CCA